MKISIRKKKKKTIKSEKEFSKPKKKKLCMGSKIWLLLAGR